MKASKMPKAKKVRRKDNPDEVMVYAKGGKTKKPRIAKEDKPPKKPAPPRLGPPLRQFEPKIPSRKLR
jgi:hypothetical protein